jgi:hypothetical protein
MRMCLLGLSTLLCACPNNEVVITMDSSVIADDQGQPTALVCPGAKGCSTALGQLHAGAGTRIITPSLDEPVYMAGFDIGRQATAIHDDVEARALVVEQGELRIGFVTLDTIGWYNQDAIRVRQSAAARDLQLDHVVVSSTHNHESKDTMGIWGQDIANSGYDEEYQQFVADQAADALADAVASLVPVRLRAAQTTEADRYVNDTRDPVVKDTSLSVLHFETDSAPVATWVVWGNHPEALGGDNTIITSDYPHYLRNEVEALLPGTTAIFTAGILGGLTTTIGLNICPDATDPTIDTCPQGTFTRAEVVGREAARAAVRALDDAVVQADVLSVKRLPFRVAPTNDPLLFGFLGGLIPRPIYDGDGGDRVPDDNVSNLTLVEMRQGLFELASEVNALRIGGVDIATIPGELYAELYVVGDAGQSLVERPEGADFIDAPIEPSVQTTMQAAGASSMKVVLNQTNDSIGYIIPRSQWDIEAPRAYDVDGQYGEQNSLGPGAAAAITQAVVDVYALELR